MLHDSSVRRALKNQLALIQAAWDRARLEQRCELVTIVGEAGVGKSHLVAKALGLIQARVVQGPLSALRGGNHLLAGGRGDQAARRLAVRPGGGSRDPLAARRDLGGIVGGGDRMGLPEAPRTGGASHRLSSTTSNGARRHSSISSST